VDVREEDERAVAERLRDPGLPRTEHAEVGRERLGGRELVVVPA
jgi:hypothetical protein